MAQCTRANGPSRTKQCGCGAREEYGRLRPTFDDEDASRRRRRRVAHVGKLRCFDMRLTCDTLCILLAMGHASAELLDCPSGLAEPGGKAKVKFLLPKLNGTGPSCEGFPFRRKWPMECQFNLERSIGDPGCYIQTKYEFQTEFHSLPSASETNKTETVAIAIMGELQRISNKTTIAKQVVQEFSAKHHKVLVFLTLQARRKHVPEEWHRERFRNLPTFNDRTERRHIETIAGLFMDAGAVQVVVHVYDLLKLPPVMPSIPGKYRNPLMSLRFRSSFTSYILHCLTRSLVVKDVMR